MARPDRIFKTAYNEALDRLQLRTEIASISTLARDLGVSRTTVRAILAKLEEVGVAETQNSNLKILRNPKRSDYFEPDEMMDPKALLETAFMRLVRDQAIRPGVRLHEFKLAKQFDVSIHVVRDFLIGLSRVGIVTKEDNRWWVLEELTKEHALELHQVRTIFEERAIVKVCSLPDSDPFWGGLIRLQKEHQSINTQSDFEKVDFSTLDARFHRFINSKAENRLILGLQDAIAMIFNYHYLWPMENEKEHDLLGAQDHLEIMDLIFKRDKSGAQLAMKKHLSGTRNNFIAAVSAQPN